MEQLVEDGETVGVVLRAQTSVVDEEETLPEIPFPPPRRRGPHNPSHRSWRPAASPEWSNNRIYMLISIHPHMEGLVTVTLRNLT